MGRTNFSKVFARYLDFGFARRLDRGFCAPYSQPSMTPSAPRCGRLRDHLPLLRAMLSLRGRPGRRNGDVRPNPKTTAGTLDRNTMRLLLFAANNNIDIAPGGTMVVPNGNDRFTFTLTRVASPCRAGASRSRPPAAKRGRAMRASLYRMAPIWPHVDKQVTVLVTLIAPARVSGQNSIRCRRHCA